MFHYYYLLPFVIIAYYYLQDRRLLCSVTKVQDGDSLTAICEGENYKLRLVCIDAPEIKQQWGLESKRRLKQLVGKKEIKVKVIKTDRYGRTLVDAYNEAGELIQLKLVEEGFAWSFLKYRTGCHHIYKMQMAEEEAKNKKLGLWSMEGPIEPWVWRKQHKISY